MKIKSVFIQLFTIGLLLNIATGCKEKEEVEKAIVPKTIEESSFFTANYSKTQVWEVKPEGDPTVGENWTLNVVGPARTLYTMQREGKQINWGSANDRYMQFKIEKGGSLSPIIDDIKNDSDTYIIARLFEKSGVEANDDGLDPGMVVGRSADGFVLMMHCSEETYYLYFSTKTLTSSSTTITIKPTQTEVLKLSELADGKVETQLDKLNSILPTAGGVSTVVFKPGATYGSMTDLNGNTYKTITIGTQTWMAENLRSTKYRNGESISIVNLDYYWTNQTTSACCSNHNTIDKNLIATQGLLYNGYAVNDSRKIAPVGWHVPTDAEWTKLITYLGGETVAGGKMKEIGITNWLKLNTDATNTSGFSATKAGGRSNENGTFYEKSNSTTYWTSTIDTQNLDWVCVYGVSNEDSYASQGSANKVSGQSVRLIKD